MSHIVFGYFDCHLDILTQSIQGELKKIGKNKNILIHFHNELHFYSAILKIIEEQNIQSNNVFALTSLNQPTNSDDLLFPYDKYTNDELFLDRTRNKFCKYCNENLDILFSYLREIIYILNIKSFNLIITNGYSDNFIKKNVNLEEIQMDVYNQILTGFSIESCMYIINTSI